MKKAILVLLVLVVVGYAAAEVFAKRFVEERIERAVAEREPQAREIRAEVSAPLLFGLLTSGAVSRIEVSASQVPVVRVFSTDRITAVLHGVELDRAASRERRRAVVRSIDRLEVTVEVAQEELSRVLPPGYRFELAPGAVTLQGPAGLSVRGRLAVQPPAGLRFEPLSVPLLPAGVRVPLVELAEVLFVSCISSVELLPGLLRVTCSRDDPPVPFPA